MSFGSGSTHILPIFAWCLEDVLLRVLSGAGNLGHDLSDLSGHLVCSYLSHLARRYNFEV
jgi:hypothetical protein